MRYKAQLFLRECKDKGFYIKRESKIWIILNTTIITQL